VPSVELSDQAGVVAAPRRWFALAAILGATFVGTVNNSIVNVALPSMADDLDVDLTAAVWIISGFALSLATMMPLAGRLGDVFGQRRVFLVGIVVFALASLVVAVAPNLPVAIVGRVLQGAAGAPVLPCIMATVARIFPAEHRGRAIGTWAAVNSGALAAGPAIGGWIIDLAGWRAIFWGSVPTIALVGIASAVLVPPDGPQVRRPIDATGAFLVTVIIFGVVAPLSLIDRFGLFDPVIGAFALAVIAAVVALRRHQPRVTEPFLDFGLVRSRRFAQVTGAAALQMVALFGLTLVVPIYLVKAESFTAGVAGLVTATLAGTMFLGSTVSGRLAERHGLGVLAVAGGLLLLSGSMLIWWRVGDVGIIVPALVVCGAGISLIQTPSAVAITQQVPLAQTGVASGLFNTARFLAGGLGATATAFMFERGGGATVSGFRTAMLVPIGGTVALLAVAAMLAVRPRRS
jgi:EmrB/QacA subfamily drug resistance transporter